MKNLAFKFYSVLKDEDAVPYIGGNLLAVADGLGGSGSAVHAIDRAKHPDMRREILSCAFGDMQLPAGELEQYINELLGPMSDGKDDTSALWASRIVIARCVYALTAGAFKNAVLSDESVRERLAEFIAKGLHETVAAFNLQKGKYDGQLLLPTTLAFVRYTEQENSVVAEAVWAGDSRLYALTADGMKLLSVDDEDESGSITNLFYADNEKVRLNYLRHELAKPCALMAVSDGVFDPFDPHDHLGVECTVLSAIEENAAAQQACDSLKRFYDGVHGDDATMAFVPFGLVGFAGMQSTFKKRADLITAIRQQHSEKHSALEVMNLSEEEAAHYVYARTGDRYEHIIPILIEAAEKQSHDIAVTPDIRKVIENARKSCVAEAEDARKNNRARAFAELDQYVRAHPEFVNSEILPIPASRFNDKKLKSLKSLRSLYDDFKQTAKRLASGLRTSKDWAFHEAGLAKRRKDIRTLIQARIEYCRKRLDYLRKGEDREECRNAADVLHVWHCMDIELIGRDERGNTMLSREEKDLARRDDKQLADDALEYIYISRLVDRYAHLWTTLLERFKRDECLTDILLAPKMRHAFGFDISDETLLLAAANAKRDRILHNLTEQKPVIVAGIVKALAANYDKTSLIDSQYNSTKLELLRTYYRLKSDPDPAIEAFQEQLSALEAAYTSLIK